MKQADILKVLAQDLGTSDLAEVNKLLRAKAYVPVKYRLSGKSLGHYGMTGPIKALTPEGVKVYDVKKVTLILFKDIEAFTKAKPREARPERPKELVVADEKPVRERRLRRDREDDGYGELIKRTPEKGSRFIPKARK